MFAKYLYSYPTIENGEESAEFEEQKVIELNSVNDLIEMLQNFVKEHPEADFDGCCGDLSIVEYHKDGTVHWLDIVQDYYG